MVKAYRPNRNSGYDKMIVEGTKEWYFRLTVLFTKNHTRALACLMDSDNEFKRHSVWLRLMGLLETRSMKNE